MPKSDRSAWLRLNAYGVVLACLAVLSLTDLFLPADAELARIVGDVPPGQPAWVLGFAEFTTTRVALVGILALCMWARCSVLWSRRGLSIRIPARGETEEQ